MKIEKLITENDIKMAVELGATNDELFQLISDYQLQKLKLQQTEETEFEIIHPKTLSKPQ